MTRVAAADAPRLPQRARAVRVAKQFEEVFVQEFVAKMRQTIGADGKGGLFGEGPGSDTYTQWFDTLMAQRLTQAGGVGVARTLIADWERYGLIPEEGGDHGARG